MIALVAPSGSGKSEIEKELIKQFGYKKVVSYTTRPARKNEKDGIDYWFQWDYQFKRSRCNFAEIVEYNGYYYAAHNNDIQDNRVIVVTLDGLRQLKEKEMKGEFTTNIFAVYIDVEEDRRIQNMRDRGDSENAIKSRIAKDKEVFKKLSYDIDIIFPNDQSIEKMRENIDIIDLLYKRIKEE